MLLFFINYLDFFLWTVFVLDRLSESVGVKRDDTKGNSRDAKNKNVKSVVPKIAIALSISSFITLQRNIRDTKTI